MVFLVSSPRSLLVEGTTFYSQETPQNWGFRIFTTINFRLDKWGEMQNRPSTPLAKERLGVFVITPFELEDGRRILVNRGYVGYDYVDKRTRLSGRVRKD